MKCPECSASLSELCDICPSCLTDLRPFKKAERITITYPAASYDALLKKLKGESGATRGDQTASLEPSSTSREEESQVAKPIQLSENPDDPSDAAEKALRELLQREYDRQTRTKDDGEAVSVLYTTMTPEDPVSRDIPGGIPVRPDALPAPARDVEHEADHAHTEPLAEKAATIPLREMIEEGPFTSQYEAQNIEALFGEAWEQIDDSDAPVELSLYRLLEFDRVENERVQLLFNLLYDSFENADHSLAFLENPALAVNSGLELVELKKAQEKIVFRSPSAPLPPLRTQQRQLARHSASQPLPFRRFGLQKRRPLVPASVWSRAGAFIVDGICLAFLSLGAGIFISLLSILDFDAFMVGLATLDPLSVVHLVQSTILGSGLMLLLYPIISFLTAGSSAGFALFDLEIEDESGAKLSLEQLVVRSCCFPLTLLLVGPFPIFPGDRLLHDYVARVRIGRKAM